MHRLILFIFLILIHASCSSVKTNKEDAAQRCSISAITSLAKTSYIKGCINGMNQINNKKTKGERLVICRELSEVHAQGIEKLLKGPEAAPVN